MLGNITRRAITGLAVSARGTVLKSAPKLGTRALSESASTPLSIPTLATANLARAANRVAEKVIVQSIPSMPVEEVSAKVREEFQKRVAAIESVMADVQSKADALRKAGSNNAAVELENLFLDLCDRMKTGEVEAKLNRLKEAAKENENREGSEKEKAGETFSNRASKGAKSAFSRFGQSFKKAMKLAAKVTAASMIVDLVYSEIVLSEKFEEKLKQASSDEAYKEVAQSYYARYAEIYEEIYQDLVKDLDPATKTLFESIRKEIVAEIQKNQKSHSSEANDGLNFKKLKVAIKEMVLTDHKLITAVSMVALALLGNPSQDVLEKLQQGKISEVPDLDKARVVASIAKNIAVKPSVGSEKFFTSLEKVFAEQHLSFLCRINKGVYNALDAAAKNPPQIGI